MDNSLLNQQGQTFQQMYVQRVCDKHEFVTVTQTTTRNGPNPINKSEKWLQCKHCSKTIPFTNQQLSPADIS